GINFEVVVSNFSESLDKSKYSPIEYVIENATEKGLEVYGRLAQEDKDTDLVIAADTVVSLDGEILEKPIDKDDAFKMLKKINNLEPVHPGYELVTFVEETEVVFRDNSDETLLEYVNSGEPLDKAG
ncbi:2012_t:CDS:2, partial [Acaulospora colombiana]